MSPMPLTMNRKSEARPAATARPPSPPAPARPRRNAVKAGQRGEAESVYLMGDFNGWSPSSHPMQRRVDGWWFLQVPLTRGHHQYQFLVDGVPTLDPHAAGVTCNERYEQDSLIAVS